MPYLPIIDRPVIKWPKNARVAFWVAPNVEHYQYLPTFDGKRNPWPRSPYPDVQGYSHFDYGNRIGFWRLLDVLDAYAIRCTVSLSLSVLDHFPEIAEAMISRNWDFMSHGFYNTEYMTTFDESRERAYLLDNIEVFKRHTGRPLRGFFGPSVSSTERTPDLLAEYGFVYYCDFMHDDQPMPLRVKSGRLISVPYTMETNDGSLFRAYGDGAYFVRVCKAQFDQLYEEGAESGRVMCLALHPCWTGQPHRIRYLDEVLDYIMSHDGVWQTTADEIADYFMENYYDTVSVHAARLR
jgi:peptidoglycan/xylan/chitin deacetylase (PgdA/CDA1 family)